LHRAVLVDGEEEVSRVVPGYGEEMLGAQLRQALDEIAGHGHRRGVHRSLL
jgi:hypothetical protein